MKKKSFHYILALSVTGFMLSGCAGTMVNKSALTSIEKAGLCSVTIDQMGQPTPNNFDVSQTAATYALAQYDLALQKITSFKYIPHKQYANHPSIKNITNFTKSPTVKNMLEKNKSQTAASALMLRMMGQQGGNNEEVLINTLKNEFSKKTAGVIAARSTPLIPYKIFKDDQEGVVTIKKSYGNAANNNENQIKTLMIDSVAYACQQTGLDAMFIIWNKASAWKHVKGVSVINTKLRRADGSIRLNPTLLLIDKTGTVVADLGWPSFDDLSPTKGSIPFFIVEARDSKKSNRRNLKLKDLRRTDKIDLKDPKGYATKMLNTLIDETSVKLVTKLRKALGEIE